MSDYLNAVEELARIAGNVAKGYNFDRQLAHTKADNSPVTEADRSAERAAREWINQHFPEDGIIGEEYGEERPDARRVWILDPIDGTVSFISGAPLWGTLVAVVEDESTIAGASYFPVLDEMVIGGRGEGAWFNGTRTSVSEVSELSKATVVTTDERFGDDPQLATGWRNIAGTARVARTWGDCYGYTMVATGRAELMMDDKLMSWDAAAFRCIIEEAGGQFTNTKGGQCSEPSGAIATNSALANEIRSHFA